MRTSSPSDPRFPIEQTPQGESFFVPTLAPQETIVAGQRAAIAARCRIRTKVGVYRGKLGVLITVTFRYAPLR